MKIILRYEDPHMRGYHPPEMIDWTLTSSPRALWWQQEYEYGHGIMAWLIYSNASTATNRSPTQ